MPADLDQYGAFTISPAGDTLALFAYREVQREQLLLVHRLPAERNTDAAPDAAE